MYSFHSSPEEKNKLLFALTQHGIETTVDRVAKKKRIRDWIQESVIQEEEDGEEEEDEDEINHTNRAPVAGHVSSVRAQEKAARTQIVSTVKDASNKHINPRTGKIQLGPSEMGHNTESHGVPHQMDNVERSHERPSYGANQMEHPNHTKEMRKENNGYDYDQPRRSIKLVDVGSQTSSESQKHFDAANTPERRSNSIGEVYATKMSHSVPTISHTPSAPCSNSKSQDTQTNLSRTDQMISRGFMSSHATVAVPKIQQTQQQNPPQLQSISSSKNRDRDRSQPRQSYYQQRHNTTALTKQLTSRSMQNFNSSVNDSGYGSLDKLRSNDVTNILTSPTFSKRSIVPSKLVALPNGGISGNEMIHINGLSHSQNECSSPFHSDSGGDGSPHGSNGFVNYTGIIASTPAIPTETNNNNRRVSMKDTAYDRVRSSRKKR